MNIGNNFRNYDNNIVLEYENIKTSKVKISDDDEFDIVYLIGKKLKDSEYYTNLKILISAGKDGKSVIILPKTNEGYNPNIVLVIQGNNKVDILYTVTYGGSGGEIFSSIYRVDNKLEYNVIFDSNDFNKEKFTVKYIDDYMIEIKSNEEMKKFITNANKEESSYLDSIFDENGKIKRTVEGSVLGVVFITPYKLSTNNYWDYLVSRRVIGEINSDTIGFIDTILRSNEKEGLEVFYNCFKKCPIL